MLLCEKQSITNPRKKIIIFKSCKPSAHGVTLHSVTQTPEKRAPDVKIIAVRVPPKIHKKLKMIAIVQDITLQELGMAALEQYLETQ